MDDLAALDFADDPAHDALVTLLARLAADDGPLVTADCLPAQISDEFPQIDVETLGEP